MVYCGDHFRHAFVGMEEQHMTTVTTENLVDTLNEIDQRIQEIEVRL